MSWSEVCSCCGLTTCCPCWCFYWTPGFKLWGISIINPLSLCIYLHYHPDVGACPNTLLKPAFFSKPLSNIEFYYWSVSSDLFVYNVGSSQTKDSEKPSEHLHHFACAVIHSLICISLFFLVQISWLRVSLLFTLPSPLKVFTVNPLSLPPPHYYSLLLLSLTLSVLLFFLLFLSPGGLWLGRAVWMVGLCGVAAPAAADEASDALLAEDDSAAADADTAAAAAPAAAATAAAPAPAASAPAAAAAAAKPAPASLPVSAAATDLDLFGGQSGHMTGCRYPAWQPACFTANSLQPDTEYLGLIINCRSVFYCTINR